MSCEPSDLPPKMKQASRAYRRNMIFSSIAYAAIVFGAVTLIRHSPFHLPQWAVIVIALTPLIPALFMMAAYVTFLRSMDEFNRRIQMEAWLMSAGVVGFASFTYSFLEEWVHFPRVDLVWVFPALIAMWGIALFFVRRRYK